MKKAKKSQGTEVKTASPVKLTYPMSNKTKGGKKK